MMPMLSNLESYYFAISEQNALLAFQTFKLLNSYLNIFLTFGIYSLGAYGVILYLCDYLLDKRKENILKELNRETM